MHKSIMQPLTMLKAKRVVGAALVVVAFGIPACGPERRKLTEPQVSEGGEAGKSLSVKSASDFERAYHLDVEWLAGPQASDDVERENRVRIRVRTRTADGQLGDEVAVDALSLKLWMKIHGHGGRDRQQRAVREGQAWVIDNFAFTMTGPWELNLRLTIGDSIYPLEVPVDVREGVS